MKNDFFVPIIFMLFSNLAGAQCAECSFFNNIKVIVTPKSRVPYFRQYTEKNFQGCFEQKQFDQVILQLAVVDQNITEIGDHAVHDLPSLSTLSFTGCGIEQISSRAFEGLPKLRVIHIDHCNLTSIAGGIFNDLPSLEDLSMVQNEISEMKSHVFAAMTSLQQVLLSRNELRAIDPLWFFDTPNISLLDFSYNKIKRIDKYTFKSTRNLKDLLLDYNQIEYLEEKAFFDLKNMELLSLRHNRITELNANILTGSFRIEILYLNANFLNFLSQDLLKKLSVKVMELAGNPWKCPCLTKIHSWMRQSNVSLKDSGYCKGHHIPQCIYGAEGNVCSETVNGGMTETFLNAVKNLDRPVEDECANLST